MDVSIQYCYHFSCSKYEQRTHTNLFSTVNANTCATNMLLHYNVVFQVIESQQLHKAKELQMSDSTFDYTMNTIEIQTYYCGEYYSTIAQNIK
jgi:hypothetical protein